jgi:hypothetical protein
MVWPALGEKSMFRYKIDDLANSILLRRKRKSHTCRCIEEKD